MTTRVFIVDDHQIFRDGLQLLLTSTEDMVFAGEADSGIDLLPKIEAANPDLLLMDVQMPDMNGIETTKLVKARFPDLPVLMLTMFEDDQTVFSAMRVGANGYVLKGVTHSELLRTIRLVAQGGAVFSPSIAERMSRYFMQMGQKRPIEKEILSSREREVLDLIAQGLDNTDISQKLFVSEKTVRNYVSRIMTKLSATSRQELVTKAQD